MQILGKRSKVLLIVVAIVMLIAVGVSFAMWDSMSTANATSGDLSQYANAKVGDVITFGKYYQTGKRINNDENAEYEKTPIEWIVVDKDERTGQLTLMSKYILACGSYFGNYYYNKDGMNAGSYYNTSDTRNSEVGSIPFNQAYAESTARAFLNNLERMDLGGDSYSTADGYKTSIALSKTDGKLLTSVGFSNRRYAFTDEYIRPVENPEYRERPATRGFYDEAFNDGEKEMILPKAIAGYTGHRWPNKTSEPQNMLSVEGVVDKIWLPSAIELNEISYDKSFTNPSEEISSKVFEYFKNFTKYKNPITGTVNKSLVDALKAERTSFVKANSKAMNYSIPVYKFQSTAVNDDIHLTKNSSDWYWTHSPVSIYYHAVRYVDASGVFGNSSTHYSNGGIRPCMNLKY